MPIVEYSFGQLRGSRVSQWKENHGFLDSSFDVSKTKLPVDSLVQGHEEVELLLLTQVHGVSILDPMDVSPGESPEADGWFSSPSSQAAGVKRLMGIKTADCIPALLLAQTGHRAALHCGWKSSVLGILPITIEMFYEDGVSPEQIEIALGPGAQSCCFETGEDVISEFNRASNQLGSRIELEQVVTKKGTRTFCNIYALLKNQALSLGIPANNIHLASTCTICNPRYFSFRRQGEQAGRQLTFIEQF